MSWYTGILERLRGPAASSWRPLVVLALVAAVAGALVQRACIGHVETADQADSLRVALRHLEGRLAAADSAGRKQLEAGREQLERERAARQVAERTAGALRARMAELEGQPAPPDTAPAAARAGYWREQAGAWQDVALAQATRADTSEARAGRLEAALGDQLHRTAALLDTLGAVRADLADSRHEAGELRDAIRRQAAGDPRKLFGLPLPRLGLGYGLTLTRAGRELEDGPTLALVWLF